MQHDPPDQAGYYWAKVIKPEGMRKGEDWRSIDWEIVQVVVNDLSERSTPFDRFGVFVPGIGTMQRVSRLQWGPRVDAIPPD
ncbi:hypothetical protein [Variibacter gotjawalensis]|uniref:hypothetical protein n=1 Tax=Variibacter gotjawalensis TaxID=1333996 RepID=UPI000BBA6B1C|nr:hypothetical protein [Variibacter gotjawalensis]NIK47854.1 hypothetical protein [Variibacter gotjawalensis]